MQKGKTDSEVVCKICSAVISIAAEGRKAIEKHLNAAKHIKALNARSSSHPITKYIASLTDYTVAACEGVWTLDIPCH